MSDSPSPHAHRHELLEREWRRIARRLLDRLEEDGFDRRSVAAAMGDASRPPIDLDGEVVAEDWLPPPAAA